jgi:hypothetical protein
MLSAHRLPAFSCEAVLAFIGAGIFVVSGSPVGSANPKLYVANPKKSASGKTVLTKFLNVKRVVFIVQYL